MTASLDTRDDATADEAPSEHTGRSWRDRTSSQWLWAVVLPLIVVTMAGAIRFHQLGQPERCIGGIRHVAGPLAECSGRREHLDFTMDFA